MSIGIRCLLAETPREARALASELDRLNRERRDVESAIHEEAQADVEEGDLGDCDAYTLTLFRPSWHQGVVGIVASRLKDRFHRPTIVFAPGSGNELRGSGRSIAGFHLRDALDLVDKRLPGAILRFGGHAYAAGLSLRHDALSDFTTAFEAIARERLDLAQLARQFESDGSLADAELTFDLARSLRERVWGQGFPSPAFDDVFDVASQRVVGEKHLRLRLERRGRGFDAIAFGELGPLPGRVHAVFRPEVSEWNELLGLELVVEHWQAAAAAPL